MATYKIVSHGGNGLPLNVETTSTISGRTNVNIWKDTGSNDQKYKPFISYMDFDVSFSGSL